MLHKNLIIEEIPFPTNGICGILFRGKETTSIALNSNRTVQMQNFDCMHELIHYFFHEIDSCQRICCDESGTRKEIKQDSYIEWQANEGAAQFLVPYQHFIPEYVKTSRKYARSTFANLAVVDDLSEKYFVSSKVISNRIDCLNYEIHCYMNGTPLEKIRLKSKYSLNRQGWNKKHDKTYCRNCLSPINFDYNHCHICGKVVNNGHSLHRLGFVNKGAGYMIYPGATLTENGHVAECPLCKNEEHLDDGAFCIVCGKPSLNRCTYALEEQFQYNPDQCTHSEPLPGNARYCPYCGSTTTFLETGILDHWESETIDRQNSNLKLVPF